MIKWMIPDNDELRDFNFWLLNYFRGHKEDFWENSKVFAAYGLLHDTIFSGGRVTTREYKLGTEYAMRQIIEKYREFDCEYRFVFTQIGLKPDMLNDYWGNLQLRLANEYGCKVIVASDLLENYIREHYPNIEFVSSTTKMVGGNGSEEDAVIAELKKDYETVVLNTRYNFNYEFIPKELRGKLEVLINDCCPPFCCRRKYCYTNTTLWNLGIEWRSPDMPCSNDAKKKFLDIAQLNEPTYSPASREFLCHYSIDDIMKAHENGIEKFKFGGRESSNFANLLERAHFMVKPEAQATFIARGAYQNKMLNERNQSVVAYTGE